MRSKIDMGVLCRRASSELPGEMDGQAALPLPEQCLVPLDEPLGD
jgi:hypothetical protein